MMKPVFQYNPETKHRSLQWKSPVSKTHGKKLQMSKSVKDHADLIL